MTVVAGSSRKLRVFVIGLRAFPNVPGGVETHAQNLYPLIAENGHEVIVASRSPYHQLNEWNGIRFVKIWAPKSKFLEAIVHSTLAVFRAAILRPDVWLDDASIGRIYHVYVHPEFRRQGIARKLMQALASHYGQYTRVRLHADNLGAATLYESLGFVAVDEAHTTHDLVES